MARARDVSGQRCIALEAWELAACAPGALVHPSGLDAGTLIWVPARAPGTVAGALRAGDAWGLQSKDSFDSRDYWYRCRFDASAPRTGASILGLRGLATLADVWLNQTHVLRSENMFHEHSVDVTRLLRGSNELVIRFSSLAAAIEVKRPRPRWKTALVEQQRLRWFRTTLFGRMPGWSPPIEAVGPWREIVLEERDCLSVETADVRSTLDGRDGTVRVRMRARWYPGRPPVTATLRVGSAEVAITCKEVADGLLSFEGEIPVPDVALWWPHTHGAQPRYPARVVVHASRNEREVGLGDLGFRSITVDRDDGGFGLVVNGAPIFCRGACWAPLDPVELCASPAAYAAALDVAAGAGMNMIRVGGTMFYEDEAFYEGCDARGLLVWQDFMFANFDYPVDDEAFRRSAEREASELLSRLQTRPCLAVLCGNSEVAQQAAMLGLSRELWSNDLFDRSLPAIAGDLRPDVAYVPSTPCGGALPFHVDQGISHYYGVGAYERPLEDARRAGVRFTSECLAFSHVPDDRTVDLVLRAHQAPVHHPAWKARVPRDAGAGWDFEDVRDHYFQQLFGLDPRSVRYEDMQRYLALSRVVTGEVLSSALGEWRRGGSTCRGALIWLFRDPWPGAGWGLLDSTGRPKAAYYFVRRVLQPVTLVITDEGLNGLALHAVNDTGAAVDANVELALYSHGEVLAASGRSAVTLAPRSSVTVSADAVLGQFLDVACAYRFGPCERDVVVGTLRDRDGAVLGRAFHFPRGIRFPRQRDLALEADARPGKAGAQVLSLRTQRFAQAVAIDVRGYLPDDNYFHIEPWGERTVVLRPTNGATEMDGSVQPLNALVPTKIVPAPRESLR